MIPAPRYNKGFLAMKTKTDSIRDLKLGKLRVLVFENGDSLAEQAAMDIGNRILDVLRTRPEVNLMLSGAESQEKFLQALSRSKVIDWTRVNYFAVDEFYAPQIKKEYAVAAQPLRILASLPLKSRNTIDFTAADMEVERRRYEELIRYNRADIACLGIGVSGHIAFNEPGQTDFSGLDDVKIIAVDEHSVEQLIQDPNFRKLSEIPKKAITVTIPFLMRCPVVSVIVPYKIKAPIVQRLFQTGEVTVDFPATILKEKAQAIMYLDRESYSLCEDIK